MSAQQSRPIVDYFRRGQVLFLVDGRWDAASEQELLEWATPIASEQGVTISIRNRVIFPSVEELLQGPGQEPQEAQEPSLPDLKVATPFLEKSGEKEPYSSPVVQEEGIFAVVSANVPELAVIPEPRDPGRRRRLSQDASKLLNLIRTLDEARGNVFGGTRLQVVSPNWLASGGPSDPGGTGGPGSRPASYEGPANTQDHKIQPDDEDGWLPSILNVPDDQRGAGVVVAILDTAPTKDIASPAPGEKWVIKRANEAGSFLATMYDLWVTQREANPPYDPPDAHPLVRGLLDPANPRLTVYLNQTVDSPNPNIIPDGYMQTSKHDYEMTDHGLFVAGIIHSLAPQAELHLYQVLNRYGVGDLETIADALLDVYTKFAGRPLVVNLSLTITMPSEDDEDEDDEMRRSLLNYRKEEEGDENSWSERQRLQAQRICDLAYALGSRVIAAAGNNRKGLHRGRPRARYPAALDSVLGVGALPKKNNPPSNPSVKLTTASYSNRSDRPQHTGITTLGGEAGKGKGLLGIYLAEFPPRKDDDDGPDDKESGEKKRPSKNGWGWWAGTSFATAIISGVTAARLGSMPGSRTEDVIVELFGGQSFNTEDNEDVLFVTQAPSPQ
ncbi:MAG TPA: S8/S53 family peptidase [Anaerolineales bacterium]|nr:S8/S53 family peptidase [Anaerolineales bacterium]